MLLIESSLIMESLECKVFQRFHYENRSLSFRKGNDRKYTHTLKPLAPLSGRSSVFAVLYIDSTHSYSLFLSLSFSSVKCSPLLCVCVCEMECMRSPCVVCYGAGGCVKVCPVDLTSAVTILDLTLHYILNNIDTRYTNKRKMRNFLS